MPKNVQQKLPRESQNVIIPEQPLVPPHQRMMQTYARHRNMQIPTPESDDEEMARAMLAVISSNTTPSSSSSSSSPWLLYQNKEQTRGGIYGLSRAFKPYNSALAWNFMPRRGVHGQKMFKKAILMLKLREHTKRWIGAGSQEATTSNQLHHVLAERKRREKLNESFNALRMLLPQGSKMDKASILTKAKGYLEALRAQVSQLEEKNRTLEMQLHPPDDAKDVGDSSKRVEVHITSSFEAMSESMQINMRVILRVECEMTGVLVHILECLRQSEGLILVSVDASRSTVALTLKVKARDWDDESFKEAMEKVVDDAVARQDAWFLPASNSL